MLRTQHFFLIICLVAVVGILPQPTSAQDAPRLDATFSNTLPYLDDGAGVIEFRYPSDWYVSEQAQSGITISLSEDPFSQDTPSVSVIPLPSASIAFADRTADNQSPQLAPFNTTLSESESLLSYTESILDRFEHTYTSIIRDDIEAVSIGNFDAVKVSYSTEFALVTATLFIVDDGADEPFAVLIFCTAETYDTEYGLALDIAATVERDFDATPAAPSWENVVESIDLNAAPLLNEYETITLSRRASQRGVRANLQAVGGDTLYINVSSFAAEAHTSQLIIINQRGDIITTLESASIEYYLPDELPETAIPNATMNIEAKFEFFLRVPSTGTYTLLILEEGDQYIDRRPTAMSYDYTIRYQVPEAISPNELVTGFLTPTSENVFIVTVDDEATIEARRWLPYGDETNLDITITPLVDRQLINETDQPLQQFMVFSFTGSSTYHGTRYDREMRTHRDTIDQPGRYAITLTLTDFGATLDMENGYMGQPFAMVISEAD